MKRKIVIACIRMWLIFGLDREAGETKYHVHVTPRCLVHLGFCYQVFGSFDLAWIARRQLFKRYKEILYLKSRIVWCVYWTNLRSFFNRFTGIFGKERDIIESCFPPPTLSMLGRRAESSGTVEKNSRRGRNAIQKYSSSTQARSRWWF
jgi:hypothetical protein